MVTETNRDVVSELKTLKDSERSLRKYELYGVVFSLIIQLGKVPTRNLLLNHPQNITDLFLFDGNTYLDRTHDTIFEASLVGLTIVFTLVMEYLLRSNKAAQIEIKQGTTQQQRLQQEQERALNLNLMAKVAELERIIRPPAATPQG